MDISLILSCIDLAKSVACYLKLCESIDSKITSLINCELNSGIRALNHAISANTQQLFYIKEAWFCFNRAISLEKDERLVLAYIGLAACNSYLKETQNAKKALLDALKVRNSGNKFIADHPGFLPFGLPGGALALMYRVQYYSREKRLESLKNDIRKYLEQSNIHDS